MGEITKTNGLRGDVMLTRALLYPDRPGSLIIFFLEEIIFC